ncbi:MAG TPA: 1,4-dihydroxy-6-naphthoate synthase [Prolixibacteraceae bacterium]|jgi:1,4-dihydroxy-6-naphthoate synthase
MLLTLGISACPIDTYIFDAMIHGRIDTEGIEFELIVADAEALNKRALAGEIDITRISYHAYAYISDSYALLNSGNTVGFQNGPILVSKYKVYPDEINTLKIAIPEKYNTANLLLNIAYPDHKNKKEYHFSDIEEVVLSGEMDAGLIINENPFTYRQKGLKKVVDIGEIWESKTGTAIPLEGIAVNRKFSAEVRQKIDRIMRRSVEFAIENPKLSYPFVKQYAQAMDDLLIESLIKLYVNEFTRELGIEGRKAIETLYREATTIGIIPKVRDDIFVNQESL